MNRRTFLKHLGIGAGAATAAIALPVNYSQWQQVEGVWVDQETDRVIGESLHVVAWLPLPYPVTPNGGDITIDVPWGIRESASFESVTGDTITEFGITDRGVVVAMR